MTVVDLFKNHDEEIGNKALRLRRLGEHRKDFISQHLWDIPNGKVLTYEESEPIVKKLKALFESVLEEHDYSVEEIKKYIEEPEKAGLLRDILERIYTEVKIKLINDDNIKKVAKKIFEFTKESNSHIYIRCSTNISDRIGASYAGIFKSIPLWKESHEKIIEEALLDFYVSFVSDKALIAYHKEDKKDFISLDIHIALLCQEITPCQDRISLHIRIPKERDKFVANILYGFYVQLGEKIPKCVRKKEREQFDKSFYSSLEAPLPFKLTQSVKNIVKQEYWANIDSSRGYGLCAQYAGDLRDKLASSIANCVKNLSTILEELLGKIEKGEIFEDLKGGPILVEISCCDDKIEIYQVRWGYE